MVRAPPGTWVAAAVALLVAAAPLLALSGPAAGQAAPAPRHDWEVTPSPNAGFATAKLSAAACVSATDCWAVGSADTGPLVTGTTMMHWDGHAWRLVPSPSVPGVTNYLNSVACAAAADCWAVGETIDVHTVQVHTIALHWDGAAWALAPTPVVGGGFNALYGVACPAASACWAVGFENGGGRAQTLVDFWDGQKWSVHASPDKGDQSSVFNSVACATPIVCWAVGYSGATGAKSTLAARWDGSAWSVADSPDHPAAQERPMGALPRENVLKAVACPAATDCWAVGDAGTGIASLEDPQDPSGPSLPLLEHWDGTAWTATAAPQLPASAGLPGGTDGHLAGLACAASSDCWAVGHANAALAAPGALDHDFALHWNGVAWLPGPALPDPLATAAASLSGVACAGASACWAVGLVTPAGSPHARIEQWDGTAWTSVAAPDVGTTEGNYLYGAACASATDCWAAGFDFYGVTARTLTLRWNGTAWQVWASPNTADDRNNYLSGLACPTPSDCWAVGASTDRLGLDGQALALHWDGSAWTVSNPLPVDPAETEETVTRTTGFDLASATETDLEAVSCASASDCWAVGYAYPGVPGQMDFGYHPLLAHWDGTAWATLPPPPDQVAADQNQILYGVSCASASDCTAVGDQWTRGGVCDLESVSCLYQTLVEHYDGTRWARVATPNVGNGVENDLYSVACPAAGECWAVGRADRGAGNPQGLALHGQGGTWAIADLTGVDALQGITCPSASDCWASGTPFGTPGAPRTLLAHWDGASWSRVPSPNLGGGKSPANNLFGLACTAPSDCWAVGQYSSGPNKQTLTLRYAPSTTTGTGTTSGTTTTPDTTTTSNAGTGGSSTSTTPPGDTGDSTPSDSPSLSPHTYTPPPQPPPATPPPAQAPPAAPPSAPPAPSSQPAAAPSVLPSASASSGVPAGGALAPPALAPAARATSGSAPGPSVASIGILGYAAGMAALTGLVLFVRGRL